MLQGGPKGVVWRMRKQAWTAMVSAVLPTPTAAPLDLNRPLKIGFLRCDRRLGEVLLQTPIFRALKAHRPADTVVAITHPRMVRVLRGQPDIDEIIPFTWQGFPVTTQSRAGVSLLRPLHLDVAVDCSDPTLFSMGHGMATRLTCAPVRIGFNRGPAADHFTHLVDVPHPLHEASARARLLAPLGITADPCLRFVPQPDKPVMVDKDVDALTLFAAEPGHHAVVVPGGRLAWRRAGPNEFAPLCHGLIHAGRTPWLAPGPGEEELCRAVMHAAPGSRLLSVTDLHQLGALMQSAGVTVCNNTGTMHLSVAVGSRTFALFARMDPTRWGHHQPEHRMVSHELEDPAEPARLRAELDAWLMGMPRPEAT